MTGFNNSNRKNIREAEKSAKLAEANRIAYTKTIMSDVFGRSWMYDLLTRCNIFHTPFLHSSSHGTAFNCGGQNIGLRIFGDVAANCPHEYTLMMNEASTKDEANGRRYESGNDSERTAPGSSSGWNSVESGNYSTDASGFVIDNSGIDTTEDRAFDS